MADNSTIVKVFTPAGKHVGQFEAPSVDMDPEHFYEVWGYFTDADGRPFEKVEFNPQVLPYVVDISPITKCNHKTLHEVYIQRGRQPIRLTGTCKLDA